MFDWSYIYLLSFYAEWENEVSSRILRLNKNTGGEMENTSTITQETSILLSSNSALWIDQCHAVLFPLFLERNLESYFYVNPKCNFPHFIFQIKEAESTSNDDGEVQNLLQNEKMLRQSAEDEASDLKNQVSHWKKLEVLLAKTCYFSVKLLLQCTDSKLLIKCSDRKLLPQSCRLQLQLR